jgi:hypothetical protein
MPSAFLTARGGLELPESGWRKNRDTFELVQYQQIEIARNDDVTAAGQCGRKYDVVI